MTESEAESGQPIINITGQKVALGPIRRDLVPLYQRWVNDFEVTRTLAIGMRPMTREAEEAWFDSTVTKADEVAFTIYERATMRPIGNTSLMEIDHYNRSAEFGMLIGDKECWGRGYGTEVSRLMLEYGFIGLGLHNVWLQVYSYNRRGIRAYLRAGFREIGRRREARRLGGRAYDIVLMDCVATEFTPSVLSGLLPDE